ncbi:hypothetical protein [Bacillus mycoides]|nr:hypothetical protein [Bacillus mycoides]
MKIEDKRILKAYKKLEQKWLNGEKVDVGPNIGYLSTFVRERQLDFFEHKDIHQLIEDLKTVITYPSDDEYFYPHLQAEDAIKEAYLTMQDYDGYWNATYGQYILNFTNRLQKILRFDDIFNIYFRCSSPVLDGRILIACVGVNEAKITKFGRAHVLELFEIMNSYVEDFIEKEGMDPFQYFYRRFAEKPLTLEQVDELKSYMKDSRFEAVKKSYFYMLKQEKDDKEEYEKWIKNDPSVVSWKLTDFPSKKAYREEYNSLKSQVLFDYEHKSQRLMGVDRNGKKLFIPYISFHQLISESFEGFCNQMLRVCENILRKKKKLPKIGEGWIGETILYYFIKESFPNEKVEHHGKPLWLGRQHLDIFFPERNIAIEYQGVQHDRPVAFFGGKEQFLKQKERDERKVRQCLDNKCRLIYVREGYLTSEVLSEVRQVLAEQKDKH